jgi:hypothetical protein
MTREQRLRIFEAADYGRSFGWFVEQDGHQLATLTEPRFEDMFWYSYKVTPLTEDETVFTKEFWNQDGLVFRNMVLDKVAPNAFPAMSASPSKENPRVRMRGLYLWISEPTLFEKFLLWRRRKNQEVNHPAARR